MVDNPNLREPPFSLVSSGIGGDPLIIEYGNDDYLLPLVDRSKVYDMVPIIRKIDSYKEKDFFACGAGAGAFELINQNCEGIFNLKVYSNGSMENEGHVVRTKGSGMEVLKVPTNETRASLLGNFFVTEGKAGKVLKVLAKNRTGEENFISAMRLALTEKYSEEVVGLGGAFVMKQGRAHVHVMDDFSLTPIDTSENLDELNNWLTFHEISAPFVALGNFVSSQLPDDFKLRFHHFHCYSDHNEGGHYHYDTTPEAAEYEGYFNVAERIILVDKNSAQSFLAANKLLFVVLALSTRLMYSCFIV